VAVPIGLLLVLRPGLRPRHVAIAAGLALAIVGLSVLVMGPVEVYQQIVQYRQGARQGASWDPRRNFKLVVNEPFREQPGLYLLAAAAALLLLAADWRSGLALASWPLAATALLVAYYPLHPKHLVYLAPPLALLGGAGLGRAAWLAWKEGPAGRTSRLASLGIAVVLAAIPLASLPGSFDQQRDDDEDADLHVFDDAAAQSIDLLTGPRDFILTDHPYAAALARRMVPPNLVDPSRGRTRAGVLTDRDAIEAAEQFDTRLVLIWADRLRRLPGIPPWLDQNYVLSHVFGARSVKIPRGAKDRAIYLRRDSDLEGARARLEGALQVREAVDYEGKLRLLGASLSTDTASPKEQFTLTLGFVALGPMSSDYHVTVHLLGPNGDSRGQQEHDLEGSARGTSIWQPGRWLFRTFAIQPEVGSPAGDYRVQISLVDPKGGKPLGPTPAPGGSRFKVERAGMLTVGTVRID
jgi:hypothetical protein